MTDQKNFPPSLDENQNRRLKEFFESQPDSGLLFTQAMAQTRMAMCIADPHQHDSPIVFANRAFCDLTGYNEDEIVGRNCRMLQGPETSKESVAEMRRIIETEEVGVCEVLNYRKDGTKFWNSIHLGPIYDKDDNLQFLFASQWDVTDVAAARVADQQFSTIMRELNHRIMNMFSVISAIITISEKSVETKKELASLARSRVLALGDAHRASISSASENRGQDLQQLLTDILNPFGTLGQHYKFVGDATEINPDLIMTLSMIIYELATNSSKYGSFAGQADTAEISWELKQNGSQDGTNLLCLTWHEKNNHKIEKSADVSSSGSGSNIMKAMAVTAGGDVEIEQTPDYRAHIELPLMPLAPRFEWSASSAPKKSKS